MANATFSSTHTAPGPTVPAHHSHFQSTATTLPQVREAGASRVAVVSAIMASDDPALASRQLLDLLV